MAKKRSKPGYFIALILFLVLAVSFAVGFYIIKRASKQFGPPDGNLPLRSRVKYAYLLNKNAPSLEAQSFYTDGLSRKFIIADGEGVTSVCNRLEGEGFTRSSEASCYYLIYSGRDRAIQPGSYTIDSGLSTFEIAQRVGNPIFRDISLRIYAGWRIEEVANAIDQQAFAFSGNQFLERTKSPNDELQNELNLPAGSSLQGYILPGVYNFKPTISLDEVLQVFASSFVEDVIISGLKSKIEQGGLSLHEGLTMASIIQRETLASQEMPLMASVFYNRLRLGMKLETDVTVQYALGWVEAQSTWWKGPLSWDDLAVDSVYNTYRFYGLPPGPLCSPGLDAIRAVAEPAQSEYLFFRAICDGSGTHNFAITYEEHLQNGCE